MTSDSRSRVGTATKMPERVNRPTKAVALMLGSVLGYSLLPLLVDLSGEWGSVAFVTGMWTLAYTCVCGGAAHYLSRRDGSGVSARSLVREIPWWAYMVAYIGAFQWVFFVWSARLTETAVTTIIFEFWPVLFLLGRKTFAVGHGKRPVSAGEVALTVVAGIGVSLVVLSNASDSDMSVALWGPVLAVIALVIVGCGRVVNIKVSEVVALRLSSSLSRSAGDDPLLKIRVGALQDAVARSAASVMLLTVGGVQAFSDGSIPVSALVFGLVLGVVHGVANLFFLGANHSSGTDLINNIYYGVPVLALVWLWAFTEVSIAEPSMFLVGVTGVVAVNMALHLDPEGKGLSKRHTDGWTSGSVMHRLMSDRRKRCEAELAVALTSSASIAAANDPRKASAPALVGSLQ